MLTLIGNLRFLQTMPTEANTCRRVAPPELQAAGWDNAAESVGKFGSADQLRNGVNQLQSLLYAA